MAEMDSVIDSFEESAEQSSTLISEFCEAIKDKEVALPIAAIQVLSKVIGRSNATTMVELQQILRESVEQLNQKGHALGHGISVAAGCEIFIRYVTRSSVEDFKDIETCLQVLRERGEQFAALSLRSRHQVAAYGLSFIRDDMVVLLHGHSRVVIQCLLLAAKTKNFRVIVTEGRPQNDGLIVAKKLRAVGMPVTLILDSAIGYVMDQVDLILVGAEAVVENGGIVNKAGTLTLATVAKACKKPLYVAVESYKFARIFPLSQEDVPIPEAQKKSSEREFLSQIKADVEGMQVDIPLIDYTPPEFVTYLLTDLGVFTPSAVSDELIKLYQ